MNILIEIIGWIGAVLIVGAYSLNIYGVWKTHSLKYIAANFFGGLFFVIHTFVHHAYPSMIVNIIWVFIAMFALLKNKS
ncbi:MAG: hypothetical protein JSU03_00950 [Bacteroidetes bacterium]|nr:hypothetical protein [Bacteroidota bacterium]MBS1755820.1 hypothetical protein [Bacteroidota bacterium]